MAIKQFRLPDVGEGLTEAEILGWSVAVGDVVKVNQILVEIETAKAAVELPSPFAGKVGALLVEAGQTVDVGTPIIEIEVAGAEPDPAPASSGAASAAAPAKAEAPKREPVLVGYGVSQAATTRRARKDAAAPVAAVASVASVAPAPVTAAPTVAPTHVLAKPLVRKLAKDLGVDLATITPAREDGVITREEVERAAATPVVSPVSAPAVTALAGDRRVPIKGVRKATAAAMVASAFTAPHVTEFLTLDATRTVELVERLRAQPEYRDVKVSPLLITAMALIRAVERFPEINASWDEAAQEIVLHGSVNLGIAAATPPLADLTGGTITITNVGVFGVDTGTPILNPGEAAILAFGAIKQQPWVHEGEVKVRWVTTLALSFDHRLVDGELGSRFLSQIGRALEDPAAVLL